MHDKLKNIIHKVHNGDAEKKEKWGIIIRGPRGTGKSSALYYLKALLRNETVFMIGSRNIELMEEYLKEAIQQMPCFGKFVVALRVLSISTGSTFFSPTNISSHFYLAYQIVCFAW